MQFSTKIDGFEQKDSQGFENSYNSYEQYPLEKFFIFTIYQNYTLALILFTEMMKIPYFSFEKLKLAFYPLWINKNVCSDILYTKYVGKG